MKHTYVIIWWGLLATFVYGCAGGLYNDGYSTYLDANGDVVRAYPANYDETVRAGAATLEKLGVMVLDRRFDKNETVVEARTPGGSALQLHYLMEGRNLTVVRVRTGRFGYTGREYSNQFHSLLEAKLQDQTKRTASQPQPASPGERCRQSTAASTPIEIVNEPQSANAAAGDSKRAVPGASPPTTEAKDNTTHAKTEQVEPISPADAQPSQWCKPDYVIFFEKDANFPRPEAMKVLDEAAQRMRANPDAAVALKGFADADEDPDDLYLVSESRSLAVKSYLMGKGIESRRIHTSWHGSHYAASFAEDASQARRVEIRLNRGL